MRLVVTGPESSGTSMVSRIFRQAGAEVVHRSATYNKDHSDLRSLIRDWCDATIVVFRDPFATMASQRWTGRPFAKLQYGYRELFYALADAPVSVFVINYEQLILDQKSINPLLEHLRLNPSLVTEDIRNENDKYIVATDKFLTSISLTPIWWRDV